MCFLFCFLLVVAFTWIPRVPRGFYLIQSHLTEMLLDDRQGFTARSARRKKKRLPCKMQRRQYDPVRRRASAGTSMKGLKVSRLPRKFGPEALKVSRRHVKCSGVNPIQCVAELPLKKVLKVPRLPRKSSLRCRKCQKVPRLPRKSSLRVLKVPAKCSGVNPTQFVKNRF